MLNVLWKRRFGASKVEIFKLFKHHKAGTVIKINHIHVDGSNLMLLRFR